MGVDRVHCCVPFCRRTRKAEPFLDEWICARHWREIPPARRRAYRRLIRRFKADDYADTGAAARAKRIWPRMKRMAVIRAGEAPR